MSLAWATIFIVIFLLPGILYHAGLYSRDRIPRDVIRTGVVGEIAAAVFLSIIIHLLGWTTLRWFGVSTGDVVEPLAQIAAGPPERWGPILDRMAFPFGLYVIGAGAGGFAAGWAMARTGLFATHKWAVELKTSKDALVTAYVMTNTVLDDKVLMYRGGLTEFYLKPDGSISYIVLNDCRRFSMSPQGEELRAGRQLSLFDKQDEHAPRTWSRFAIDSASISNILFEKSPALSETKAGQEALRKALEDLEKALAQPSSTR
jgi:hypothetical protein